MKIIRKTLFAAGLLALISVGSSNAIAFKPSSLFPLFESTKQNVEAPSDFSQCTDHFPRKDPVRAVTVNAKWKAMELCSKNFAVMYSQVTKTPLFVVEKLNKALLDNAKDEKRTDEFFTDQRIPRSGRSELADYAGGNFDRGHMAPAADQPDQVAMAQSFALSNIVPQDPYNNRKPWAKIESDVRKYVRRASGDVYVFTGPIFLKQQTIGRNDVWVPTHLFKMVYDEKAQKTWAYILENSPDSYIQPPVNYAEFVRQTGWQLLGRPG